MQHVLIQPAPQLFNGIRPGGISGEKEQFQAGLVKSMDRVAYRLL